MHHTRALVAINGAQLGPANWQLPVTAQGACVCEHVKGAVHGLELVLPLIYLHGAKHALGIEVEVAGGLPQADIGHVWCVQQFVSSCEMGLTPKILDQQAHPRPAGMPEHKPSPGLILDREQIQVGAQSPVVPSFGLFLAPLVFRQLFSCFPGGAVDALQLGFGFIATPIGAGDALKLEGLGVELAGVGYVGPGAEVPPLLAQGVETDGLADPRQDLQFVRLVLGFDPCLGISAAYFDPLKRQTPANDLAHLLFYCLEIGLGEGIGIVEVVIKAALGPRANGDLGLGKELLHRHGQHMAHRVTDAQQLVAFAGFGQGDRCGLGAAWVHGH